MDPRRHRPPPSSCRLPRADGDGPTDWTRSRGPVTAPPCRRGWTVTSHTLLNLARGSPVQTGMDPRTRRPPCPRAGLPRADGDGPKLCEVRAAALEAPPCRRGWTALPDHDGRRLDGSPVQTGMDPAGARPPSAPPGLPRADGDGPPLKGFTFFNGGAPPCRRGWTLPRGAEGQGLEGSPVQTGMDPRRQSRAQARAWLPRADGDGPSSHRWSWARASAPPCRRGWTRHALDEGVAGEGSPVQTGMDRPRRPTRRRPGRLPRADGDGPMSGWGSLRRWSAPPCRRGWTLAGGDGGRPDYGSPVQTGMDPAHRRPGNGAGRLPRADGDGPATGRSCALAPSAPPCRRGWTRHGGRPQARALGSPVQTGMDPRRLPWAGELPWLPRADGDGPSPGWAWTTSSPAPPCRRGWTAPEMDR